MKLHFKQKTFEDLQALCRRRGFTFYVDTDGCFTLSTGERTVKKHSEIWKTLDATNSWSLPDKYSSLIYSVQKVEFDSFYVTHQKNHLEVFSLSGEKIGEVRSGCLERAWRDWHSVIEGTNPIEAGWMQPVLDKHS